MADGNLINPIADMLLGAVSSVFAKGVLATGLSKVGVTDVDTQKLGAGALTFGTGFLLRNKTPELADGMMGGSVALVTKDLLTKYAVSDDFGLSKMGQTSAAPSGYISGPRGTARPGMNSPLYSRVR